MTKGLLKYNYPQIIFADEIVSYLKRLGKPLHTIIDCPCGNGETSFNLAKLTGSKVMAYDISVDSIQRAKTNFPHSNVEFSINTIQKVLDSNQQFDAFCIINSLFLLPEYDLILKTVKDKVTHYKAKVIIIIPNTEGKNFQWFQSQGTNENKLIITKQEIEPFFVNYGFTVDLIKPICYTHHYNRSDVKLFSVYWSFYLNFLNKIQSLFKIGKPNYFLIALTSQ